MHPQYPLWDFIRRSMANQKQVMLLYVLESNGSSPGRQGFGMAVNHVGDMVGSIGGGIMEHKFVEMVKAVMQKGSGHFCQLVKQVHDKRSDQQSGMICSGDQTICIYQLQHNDINTLQAIAAGIQANENGTLQITEAGISYIPAKPEAHFFFEQSSAEAWTYMEMTGYKNQLFIAGGGHCSLALSKMMSDMDFCIHVFDERKNLNTMEQNVYAHHKQVIDHYNQLEQLISGGPHHCMVLMTFGYRTDDTAIRVLLPKEFQYFGVLGSAKKIEKMFSDYIAEGISEERLKRIHAPVGLAIHSQTPEEIAVSIAAQIIQVKNAGK